MHIRFLGLVLLSFGLAYQIVFFQLGASLPAFENAPVLLGIHKGWPLLLRRFGDCRGRSCSDGSYIGGKGGRVHLRGCRLLLRVHASIWNGRGGKGDLPRGSSCSRKGDGLFLRRGVRCRWLLSRRWDRSVAGLMLMSLLGLIVRGSRLGLGGRDHGQEVGIGQELWLCLMLLETEIKEGARDDVSGGIRVEVNTGKEILLSRRKERKSSSFEKTKMKRKANLAALASSVKMRSINQEQSFRRWCEMMAPLGLSLVDDEKHSSRGTTTTKGWWKKWHAGFSQSGTRTHTTPSSQQPITCVRQSFDLTDSSFKSSS